MISNPDFDTFGDHVINCGDLEGDSSGLAELFTDSGDDRILPGPLSGDTSGLVEYVLFIMNQ
jgi:hypothetical protein